VFQKAGLDVENPPKTWPEVLDAARKIVSSGAATCGYTSTWLTWIHLENFAAWNNQSYATKDNGLGGPDIELKINSPIFVKHMQDIADLAKEGVFYGGTSRRSRSSSGECGLFTKLGRARRSKSGMNYAPGALRADAEGAPRNTVPGELCLRRPP
jgi:sn-glycerol 3-phosphate transport system substrate-binding protein